MLAVLGTCHFYYGRTRCKRSTIAYGDAVVSSVAEGGGLSSSIVNAITSNAQSALMTQATMELTGLCPSAKDSTDCMRYHIGMCSQT